MKLSGIYQIQSKIKPNRIYIGSSNSIRDRWDLHLCNLRRNNHHSSKLQNHVNKYGIEDLQFSILFLCDPGALLTIEQLFLDSENPYFNVAKIAGGGWNRGIKRSEETKRKISSHKRSDEFKQRMRIIRLGVKPSIETRKKQSESAKKRKPNRLGAHHSQKTRDLLSKRTKEYHNKIKNNND